MAEFRYSGNVVDDLLHMNLLKRYQVEFLYKNNYFFLPEQSILWTRSLDKKRILLQNIEMEDAEVEYHSIINRVPVGTQQVQGLFGNYQEQEYDLSQGVKLPESGYLAGGNMVALYFRSPRIANPLDVLWAVSQQFRFEQPYYSILFDYFPVEDQIIYQFVARFNHETFRENILEIIQVKKLVTQVQWPDLQLGLGSHSYPQIHQDFEEKILAGAPDWRELDFQIELVRPAVYLPEGEGVIASVESLIVGG